MTLIPTFCGKDCGGDACPLLARLENGRVTQVINNPAGGKYLKGCRRGFGLPLEQYAPDRLLTPLVRSGPRGSRQFRQASWDEALDRVAQALVDTREKYGAASILNMGSAGVTGAMHGSGKLLARFLALFGGCTKLTGSYSTGAASFVLPYVLGNDFLRAGFDAAAMQYPRLIILWGANLLETRQGAEMPARLLEARQRGAEIVVIDPRRTPTVKQCATWWIPIRPGTDAALMLAVLHVWISEGLLDRDFIRAHAAGFEALEEYIMGKSGSPECSPAWAADICGIPEETIFRFARLYAASKPALLMPGYSIQRVHAGEESYRLSVALQVASGNFGVRGGSTGALNNRLPTPRVGSLPVPPTGDRASLPITRWPDAVLEGRAGGYPADIHAIYAVGSNFVNQGGDVRKNMAAFAKVDFAVCHELFLTPTARWCDVVLPAAGPLEKEDIGIPWAGNYILYKPQILSPLGEARSDYDIMCSLADRLGFGEAFSEGRSAGQWIERFIQESEITDVDEFKRTGFYYGGEQERVGLADFSADPVGHPLSTPSGKVEIASQAYAAASGAPAIPTWQAPPADSRFPLLLITPKTAARTHSQGSNIPAVRGREDHVLTLCEKDAAIRGIAEGDEVELINEQGRSRIHVHLCADIAAGVVSLPEGIWVDFDENGADRAGSANVLTATTGTAAGKACIMHAVGVEVRKA